MVLQNFPLYGGYGVNKNNVCLLQYNMVTVVPRILITDVATRELRFSIMLD
jgi:hypothetical protein